MMLGMAELTAREMQSNGGKARAANLTKEERKKIARHAAQARWAKKKKKTPPPKE